MIVYDQVGLVQISLWVGQRSDYSNSFYFQYGVCGFGYGGYVVVYLVVQQELKFCWVRLILKGYLFRNFEFVNFFILGYLDFIVMFDFFCLVEVLKVVFFFLNGVDLVVCMCVLK